MMLTTKGRYGMMAMADIAAHDGQCSPVRLSDIAVRQNVPLNYLEQIASSLKSAGLLTSVRGPGGGYKLAKSAEEITLLSVVEAAEEEIHMTRCGHGADAKCTSNGKCLTHDVWHELESHIKGFFAEKTLARLVGANCSGNAATYGMLQAEGRG